MPWCPNCRAEYRPGFSQCAKCQAALVEEEPAPPSIGAGWPAAEKTAAVLQSLGPFRREFSAGLQTAREAAQITFRSRNLLLAILLLTTLAFLGQVVLSQVWWAQHPETARYAPLLPEEKQSLGQRWWYSLSHYPFPDYLIRDFSWPLRGGTSLSVPWISTAMLSWQGDKYMGWGTQSKVSFWSFWMVSFWQSSLCLLVDILIFIGILGWLLALANATKPKPWRKYLKAHYGPILAVAFCMILGFHILLYFPNILSPDPFKEGWFKSQFVRVISWILPILWLLLSLAPFAIVSRNLGAWGGVKAGVRLLREKKWALLAVFVGYRILYEVLSVIRLAVPYPNDADYGFAQRIILSVGPWLVALAFALLGLWLAMCFILLVKPEEKQLQSQES
jgi:hypothetical protein